MVEEDKTEKDKQEETLSVKTGEIPLQVSFHAQTSFFFQDRSKSTFCICDYNQGSDAFTCPDVW